MSLVSLHVNFVIRNIEITGTPILQAALKSKSINVCAVFSIMLGAQQSLQFIGGDISSGYLQDCPSVSPSLKTSCPTVAGRVKRPSKIAVCNPPNR